MWDVIFIVIISLISAVFIIVGSVLLHHIIVKEKILFTSVHSKLDAMEQNVDTTIQNMNEAIISMTDGSTHFKKLQFAADGPGITSAGPDCIEMGNTRFCKQGIWDGDDRSTSLNGLLFSKGKADAYDLTTGSTFGMDETSGIFRFYGPSQSSGSYLSMGFAEGPASFRDVFTVSSRDVIGSREDQSTVHGDLKVTGKLESESLQDAIDRSDAALQLAQKALKMCKTTQEST